jgi:hypothetical protein
MFFAQAPAFFLAGNIAKFGLCLGFQRIEIVEFVIIDSILQPDVASSPDQRPKTDRVGRIAICETLPVLDTLSFILIGVSAGYGDGLLGPEV